MAYTKQKPTIRYDSENPMGDDTYHVEHPAYGMITLTHPQGGNVEMFGSDITHNSRMSITIYQGHEDRHLSNTWYRQNKILCEFEMTHAQWASFICSQGMGTGTPVTLRYHADPSHGLVRVPGIEGQLDTVEKHRKELRKSIDSKVEKGAAVVDKIRQFISEGKRPTKKEMEALVSELERSLGRFASDAVFSLECLEEEMENLVVDAKSEIEAQILQTIQRVGLENLPQVSNLLVNKEK